MYTTEDNGTSKVKTKNRMTQKNILNKLFHSSSNLWNNYISTEEELNTLYYPSAGEDLRPFVFTKKENLEYLGLGKDERYKEPNLFIFSDYFPFDNSTFFDSVLLHQDNNTTVIVEEYCELEPTDEYQYKFNKEHVHFEPSTATGKAIFFKARIKSHIVNEEYFKHAIYFFYENVNLIEQLFLKNKFSPTHVVWKRDGTGLGGGNVRLDFLYHISARFNMKFFFIWDHYLDEQSCFIDNNSYSLEQCPNEIKEIIKNDEFELTLEKKLRLHWGYEDIMNFYITKQVT